MSHDIYTTSPSFMWDLFPQNIQQFRNSGNIMVYHYVGIVMFPTEYSELQNGGVSFVVERLW